MAAPQGTTPSQDSRVLVSPRRRGPLVSRQSCRKAKKKARVETPPEDTTTTGSTVVRESAEEETPGEAPRVQDPGLGGPPM